MGEFRTWAETVPALSALHRAIREQPLASDTLEVNGTSIVHPKDIMEHKREHWVSLWGPPGLPLSELPGLVHEIRQRVSDEALPPLD
eukprot:4103234-Pyramimonas_sp.AAC.1